MNKMPDLERKTGVQKREKMNGSGLLKVSSFVYNNFYAFKMYTKQAFVSYLNKHLRIWYQASTGARNI